MALPRSHQISLTPHEIEFIAEETEIEIVPLFGMDPIRLLSGIYGPFRPPQRTKIPFWLAINLKGKRKCHILPPEWLSVDSLQALLAHESSLTSSFARLPSRQFSEISKMLLDAASDNLVNPSQIRSLLKDIREVRQAKLRTGIKPTIGEDGTGLNGEYLQLTNLTPLEINELRPFFVRAMGVMTKLRPPEPEAPDDQADGPGEEDEDEDGDLSY
ncbi:Uncharacterized conserved protein [Phaffia rhodozyma]|uniref:DNA replication complex GINS protein PSF2 n=1 Tax=Phaffia rhodozyma TaxID=264483 RepID=A0A0F7SRL2_PHARH|nr:Uncharacterized conserved protein [Phaffia rhodozyma]